MTNFQIIENPAAPVPESRCPISIRTATMSDVPFIDELQKMHPHMVGWFPRKAMEKYIEGGHTLIAESEQCGGVGYCIHKDQYLKRDDVGIIYQLNVAPLAQRNLIGVSLVREAFNRAAYGCRLYCCWCAQDIQANWFWESIGFVPLAFRTGSKGKQRVHIFWQSRTRHGDTQTPWWYPYQTQGGAIREDRLVFPIPPDMHWRDVLPIITPQAVPEPKKELPTTLPGGAPVKGRPVGGPKLTAAQRATIVRAQSAHLKGVPVGKKAIITGGGIKYVDRDDYIPELDAPPEELLAEFDRKNRRQAQARPPKTKADEEMLRKARELRDRYLEHVNGVGAAALPGSAVEGKYLVGRQVVQEGGPVHMLDAA